MSLKNRHRDGFSLIEMMIVIAIMAVLTGGVTISYYMIRSADTKGTAYDIDSRLTTLKSRSMGSNKQIYLQLYRHSGEIYVDYTEEESYTPSGKGEPIGDSEVILSCDGAVMSDGSVSTIAIQKKDGAFLEGPEEIKVSDDGGTSFTVYLIKDTGKHYVESN